MNGDPPADFGAISTNCGASDAIRPLGDATEHQSDVCVQEHPDHALEMVQSANTLNDERRAALQRIIASVQVSSACCSPLSTLQPHNTETLSCFQGESGEHASSVPSCVIVGELAGQHHAGFPVYSMRTPQARVPSLISC